ncbi:uncharacterized protein YbbC (DUF1343 family) [Breznakibacter xylanolyticus]|uniref:Uncharacterized protein YbbC (DUF1343 family) n=1 Tax=Breznakibacter xylanolyticus TaxID=990 RepID=A0A2W7NXY2_9BACT|nr:DUF1343 domain-containing protein [Breznakibacter xylanolyticus]PZX18136.1 uncharacterized protein YbbC (DUF1343 family) [Breznakibacter xylanolyticus]
MRIPYFLRPTLLVACCVTAFHAGCAQSPRVPATTASIQREPLVLGAERMDVYLPKLDGKRVALLVNHTSMVKNVHLADTLLRRGVKVVSIFSPEHGFRGDADAGAKVDGGRDEATGLPVVSLYGSRKKPTPEQLRGIDCVVFDIQDVGVRFYTYISSLHYLMEACAENGVGVMVLDRPNPNGDYVDGPVLDLKHRSFVGMHPIPVVHGLTVGELAGMVNGEKWLAGERACSLTVVPMTGYDHQLRYEPPVKPSPNLPNYASIRWYPSLCFFEATPVSVGRGTAFPFQVAGYPDPAMGAFTFTPQAIAGMDSNPLHKGKTCYGIDLRAADPIPPFTLKILLDFRSRWTAVSPFVNRPDFFTLLAGTDALLKQIDAGMSEAQIRASWQPKLEVYRALREKYLLYRP